MSTGLAGPHGGNMDNKYLTANSRIHLPVSVPGALWSLGDVHGDLKTLRLILLKAGVIDHDDRWIAGNLVFVQTGDVLDRGGER